MTSAAAIRSIWTETLELDEAFDDDNFFELGGNSLTAIQLLDRLNQLAGAETVSLRDFFADPTLRLLLERVDAS